MISFILNYIVCLLKNKQEQNSLNLNICTEVRGLCLIQNNLVCIFESGGSGEKCTGEAERIDIVMGGGGFFK